MIRVQREPEPPILSVNKAEWTAELCEKRKTCYSDQRKYEQGEKSQKPKAQNAIRKRYAHADITRALKRMFGSKCCYCEGKGEATARRDVEHFRPQSIYPALAYHWDNLLYSCQRCNREHKRDRFPLGMDEIEAQPNRDEPCLLDHNDEALLINPCQDDPTEHFAFVFGERLDADYIDVTLACKTRRGEISRLLYGLDREDLVDDWREHLLDIQEDVLLYRLAEVSGNRQQKTILKRKFRRLLSPSSRYSAMTRAYIVDKHGIAV